MLSLYPWLMAEVTGNHFALAGSRTGRPWRDYMASADGAWRDPCHMLLHGILQLI